MDGVVVVVVGVMTTGDGGSCGGSGDGVMDFHSVCRVERECCIE